MIAEIFIGWFVDEFLSTAIGLVRGRFRRPRPGPLLKATLDQLSGGLPAGEESEDLVKAVGRLLRTEKNTLVSGSATDPALWEAQLRPLLPMTFERDDGAMETGEERLARWGLDLRLLARNTMTATTEAIDHLARREGGWTEVARQRMERELRAMAEGLIAERAGLGGVTHRTHETPHTASRAPGRLVGRGGELRELSRFLGESEQNGVTLVISAVHGMGGVGKTALTRTFAAQISDRFPDGHLEVDLCGFTPHQQPRPPLEVLHSLLREVGEQVDVREGSTLAQLSERWRRWLAGHTVLLVLDNAFSEEQVRHLLPGRRSRSVVLITSRNRLDHLDDVRRLAVNTLPPADAVALLRRYSAAADEARLRELARICGYLPLALCVLGPHLAETPAGDLLDLMRRAAHPLDPLAQVDPAARSVRAAFEVSYRRLPPVLQDGLRSCAAMPGPSFDAGSFAAYEGIARGAAALQLGGLARHSLVMAVGPERYALHDLFIPFVRELSADDGG